VTATLVTDCIHPLAILWVARRNDRRLLLDVPLVPARLAGEEHPQRVAGRHDGASSEAETQRASGTLTIDPHRLPTRARRVPKGLFVAGEQNGVSDCSECEPDSSIMLKRAYLSSADLRYTRGGDGDNHPK
jgi:hypothetical protein